MKKEKNKKARRKRGREKEEMGEKRIKRGRYLDRKKGSHKKKRTL